MVTNVQQRVNGRASSKQRFSGSMFHYKYYSSEKQKKIGLPG